MSRTALVNLAFYNVQMDTSQTDTAGESAAYVADIPRLNNLIAFILDAQVSFSENLCLMAGADDVPVTS